jgi:hypothetical protein
MALHRLWVFASSLRRLYRSLSMSFRKTRIDRSYAALWY